MKIRFVIITILMLLSQNTWAIGDEKENGGDVLACNPTAPDSYEVLDLYEARALHHLELIPAQNKDLGGIFEERVQALESIDPIRAALYRDFMATFPQEARFVADSDFTDVPDEGFKSPPKGCRLRQIVVQYDKPTPDGIRYMINQDLWNHLSVEHRAALLLHEFIYREGRLPQNNFRTSSGVRYLNGLLHSTRIKSMSIQDYIAQLRAVGFQEIVVQGEPLILFTWNQDKTQKLTQDIDFHTNGKVAHATLAAHFNLPGVVNGIFTCRNPISSDHSVYFFSNGVIATIHVGCEKIAYSFHMNQIEGYVFGSTFTYDESGKLYNIFTEEPQGMVFRYWSSKVHVDGMSWEKAASVSVTFFENGTPQEVATTATAGWTLQKFEQNQWTDFVPFAGTVTFSPDGDLQSTSP